MPTPQEEERCRVCRERKVSMNQRTLHTSRIQELLFSQAFKDIHRYAEIAASASRNYGPAMVATCIGI